MKLLEYEAKLILRQHGIAVPSSVQIKKGSLPQLNFPVVLKSQVPIGGRGKLGGVVIVDRAEEVAPNLKNLFALDIKGFTPRTILAEEKLVIEDEHYLCLLIDRDTASIQLVAHVNGGIEVEDNSSGDFFNEAIDQTTLHSTSQLLADHLHYDASLIDSLVTKLYETFVKNDATLLEINPLIHTKSGELVCGDCKMELDDAAGFRHPEWAFEDESPNANFVVLNRNGNVATIANGAGLAMATVDAVSAGGMTPANFLDIGGGATTASVLAAFEQIQGFPNIQAIVINIFAGITRCDQIAQAVIEARRHMTSLPPLFIRLAGTNFEEAVALLANEDIPTLGTLEDCLKTAKEEIYG